MNTLAAIILAVITTPEAPRFLPMTEAWQTNRPIPAAFVASGTFVRGSRVEPEITRETVTNAAAVLSIFDGYWERDQIARCSLTNYVTHGTGTEAVVANLWRFQEPQWKEVDYRATVTNVGWVDSSSYPTNRETSPTLRLVEAHRLAQVNDHLGVVHSLSGEDFLTETFGREAFFESELGSCQRWPDYGWAARYPFYLDHDRNSVEEWKTVLPTFAAVESRDWKDFSNAWDCPARRFWTPAWERVMHYYDYQYTQAPWPRVNFDDFVHGWSRAYGYEGWAVGSGGGLEYRYAIQSGAIPGAGKISGVERVLKYDVGDMDATNQYRVATQMLGRVYLRHDRNYLGSMNQLLADCEWDIRTPEPDTLPAVASNACVSAHAYGHLGNHLGDTYWMVLNKTRGIDFFDPGGYNPVFIGTADGVTRTESISGAMPTVARSEPRFRFSPATWAATNRFSITASGQFDCTTKDVFRDFPRRYVRDGDGFDFDLLFTSSSGEVAPWSQCRLSASSWHYVEDGVTNLWNADGSPITAETDWMIWDETAECLEGSVQFAGELGALAGAEWTLPCDRDPADCTNAAARALWDCGALTNIEISTAEGRVVSTNAYGAPYHYFDPADSTEPEPHCRCRSGYGKFNAASPYEHTATRRRLLDEANAECSSAAYAALGLVMPGLGDRNGRPIEWLLPPLRKRVPEVALADLPARAESEMVNHDNPFRAGPLRLAPIDPHYRGFAELGVYSDGSVGIVRIYKVSPSGVRSPVRWTDRRGPGSISYEGDVGQAPYLHTLAISCSLSFPWLINGGFDIYPPVDTFTRPVGADVHQGIVERRFWSWHNLRRQ